MHTFSSWIRTKPYFNLPCCFEWSQNTDIDFENCVDLIKSDFPEQYLDTISDVISYKWSYFKESYHNIIRILHGMRGYR